MIEAPLKLQEQLSLAGLPLDHLAACAAAGVSVVDGHAIDNSKTGDITDDVNNSESESENAEDYAEGKESFISNARK